MFSFFDFLGRFGGLTYPLLVSEHRNFTRFRSSSLPNCPCKVLGSRPLLYATPFGADTACVAITLWRYHTRFAVVRKAACFPRVTVTNACSIPGSLAGLSGSAMYFSCCFQLDATSPL